MITYNGKAFCVEGCVHPFQFSCDERCLHESVFITLDDGNAMPPFMVVLSFFGLAFMECDTPGRLYDGERFFHEWLRINGVVLKRISDTTKTSINGGAK